ERVMVVRFPSNAPEELLKRLGRKVPLEPAAAFLLRKDLFSDTADREALVERFQRVFRLSTKEFDTLFESLPDFELAFDETGFTDAVSSLPANLPPPSPSAGPAPVGLPGNVDQVVLAPTRHS